MFNDTFQLVTFAIVVLGIPTFYVWGGWLGRKASGVRGRIAAMPE